MKIFKILLFIILVSSSVLKAENVTVTIDGLYYALDPTSNYRRATLVEPVESSYVGEIKVPNKITYYDKVYYVDYIQKSAFQNSAITKLVLPYSFRFVDEPYGSPGGVGNISIDIDGGNRLESVEKIEELRKTFHKVFDSCMDLKEIYRWASYNTTSEIEGDGHVYFDNLYKPYKDNWIDSNLLRWHIYTPKNTNPQVKFSDAESKASKIGFVFSTGNFVDYPSVESIEFTRRLYFDSDFFFNSDVKMNCPKLKEFIYNNRVGCLYYHNKIFLIPPGLEDLTIPDIYSFENKYTLAYSNIKKLTIQHAFIPSSDISQMYENFDGDITVETNVPLDNDDDFFASFANVMPGHNLYCDPINFEKAKKFWPGEVKANDLYIASVVSGLTSMVIEFGGSSEKLDDITGIRQYDLSHFYGQSRKLSKTKWVLEKIKNIDSPALYLTGLSKTINSHPYMINAVESRMESIGMIAAAVTNIKQSSAEISIEVPGVGEYDEDVLATTVAALNDNSEVKTEVKTQTRNKLNYILKGLSPGSSFGWVVKATYFDSGDVENLKNDEVVYSIAGQISNSTPELKVTEFEVETTQCGVKVTKLKANFDDSWSKESISEYYFSIGDWNLYKVGEQAILNPKCGIGLNGEPYSTDVNIYLYSGKYGKAYNYITHETVELKPLFKLPVVTPTTLEISIAKGDAVIKSQKVYYTANGINAENNNYPSVEGSFLHSMPQGWVYICVEVSGERPDGKTFKCKLGTSPTLNGGIKFYMPPLKIDTQPVKVVNAGEAIVCAETNISDRETNFGFQWKKFDAPESLTPSEAYCGIYDGVVEGFIKNLSTSNYYNVRAFYRDIAGNCIYGKWVTFDPSDFSFFEPTVHTYATTEVSHNTASIRGYVLRGSDKILDQGFEYGRVEDSDVAMARIASVSKDATVVSVSGHQVIEYTISNLEADTEYYYRSYVTTKEGIYYGETCQFRTDGEHTGVENIVLDTERTLIGVVDLTGKYVSADKRGVCIEIYSDGTTRKVIRK